MDLRIRPVGWWMIDWPTAIGTAVLMLALFGLAITWWAWKVTFR